MKRASERAFGAPTFEVNDWILRFGSKAELLEPAALRAELAKEVVAMPARYGRE